MLLRKKFNLKEGILSVVLNKETDTIIAIYLKDGVEYMGSCTQDNLSVLFSIKACDINVAHMSHKAFIVFQIPDSQNNVVIEVNKIVDAPENTNVCVSPPEINFKPPFCQPPNLESQTNFKPPFFCNPPK